MMSITKAIAAFDQLVQKDQDSPSTRFFVYVTIVYFVFDFDNFVVG